MSLGGTRLCLAAAIVCTLAGSAAAPARAAAAAHPCLVVTGNDDPTFARNFNPFEVGTAMDFTLGGIYEPLVIVTAAGGGRQYDWLASAFAWSRDRRTLTLTVRRGVRWSDGVPLTAADVAYTLTAGRQSKAMDQIGLTRRGNEVVSVRAVGADEVAIRLDRADSQFVSAVLAGVVVVPEHVFAHVKNVGAWSNRDPVGTGPFDVVRQFGTQSYTLGRNPHYWQPGVPRFSCIQRIASSSAESALFQMLAGAVDLTNDLFPNVQKAYVAHDPAHFHYYYPAEAPGVGLFLDDTVYPFSLVALRKAISLAIDRPKLTLAEYRYAPPVDALGIDRIWPQWLTASAAAEARSLATYDPDAARRVLLVAGFTYAGTTLVDPHGDPVKIDAIVPGGWPDWYADMGLISDELRSIGIDFSVDAKPDFGAWYPDAAAIKEATILWDNAGDTASPYVYFKEHLDPASFVPPGRDASATGNWERFGDPAAVPLLEAFRSTADPAAQHRIAGRLENLFLADLPFVPLFAEPTWSTYSTRHFTGFPSAADDYVQPDFQTSPEYVVALTRIRPRG